MNAELENRIRQEIDRGSELDLLIRRIRQMLTESGSDAQEASQFDLKISSAENRLHEWIVRFNHTISGNAETKEQIELLRKERETFNSIYARMKHELKEITGRISNVVQKTDSDYAARDLAKSQILQLKDQADREHAEFEKEWSELARLIENDKRMREFIEQRELRKKTPVEGSGDKRVVEKVLETGDESSYKVRLANLQGKFDSIRLATGMTSIDQLISFFVEKEKRTFSLYNKATENMESLVRYEGINKSIREQIGELSGIIKNTPRVQPIEDEDENKRSKIELRTNELNSKHLQMTKFVSSLRLLIQAILERTFPDQSEAEKYLDLSIIASSATIPIGTVTDSNAVEYLAAIEARVGELLDMYRSIQASQKRASIFHKPSHRKSVIGTLVKTQNAPQPHGPIVLNKMTQFKLPAVTDDDLGEMPKTEEPDEALRLISRTELVSRTTELIKRNHERFRAKKGNVTRALM
jgi:hypothetical protein